MSFTPSAPSPLPHSAEAVIVGGGVMGASIAFHLAEAGVTDILLLEQGDLACGSSGKPIGGVRAQFSDPLNIRLGQRSLDAFHDFGRRTGADIGLDTVGYLFLITSEEQARSFERSVATQNELGVPSRMVTPEEARRLCPYVTTDGLVGAAFSRTDGHARPGAVVAGYARAATRMGATVRTGCAVTGIETAAGRVTAVHTDHGKVRTRAVVCAAGAWSASVGALAGVDIPVRPLRRQIAFTAPLRPRPPRVPFTIDFASTAYFHNSDDGLLLGMSDPHQPEGFDTTFTEEWLERFRAVTRDRAPDLERRVVEAGIAGGWAGLYELTPDHNALIGSTSTVEGILYATGFSGHGFLQAPAVGEIVRDLYLGRDPWIDVTPLTAARFDGDAATRPESAVV